MSFVEGFASAFVPMVQTYAQMTLKADYEQENQFLKDWKDSQKSFEALKLKDAELVEAAKTAVSMVPGVPPSAWTNAYRMLKAGWTVEQVNKNLTGAAFSEVAPAAEVKLDNKPSIEPLTPTTDPVGDQMKGAGLDKEDNKNSFFSMFSSSERSIGRDKAIDKIVKETGLTRDEVLTRVKSPTYGYQSNVPENKYQMTITPDAKKLTSADVSGQFSAASKRFANDPAGWENWKTTEYPKLVEALKAGDLSTKNTPNDQRLSQIITQLDTEKDPTKRAALEAEGNSILQATSALATAKRNEDPYSLVKVDENGAPSFLTNAVEVPALGGKTQVLVNNKPIDATGYRRVSEEEAKEREAVSRSSTVPIGDYRKKSSALIPTMELFTDITSLVDQDERVLTTAAGIASSVKKLGRETASLFSVYQDVVSSKQQTNPGMASGDIVVTKEELEAKARALNVIPDGATLEDVASGKFLGNTVNRLASNSSQLESKMLLLTFRVAGLEGQTGNALSNKDFDRFQKIVTGSVDAADFRTKLSSLVGNGITRLESEFNLINDAPDVRNFKEKFGYSPIADGRLVMRVEDQVKRLNNPKVTAAYQMLRGGEQPNQAQPEPAVATPSARTDAQAPAQAQQPKPAEPVNQEPPTAFTSGSASYTYVGRGQNGEYVYDGPNGRVQIPSSILFKSQ